MNTTLTNSRIPTAETIAAAVIRRSHGGPATAERASKLALQHAESLDWLRSLDLVAPLRRTTMLAALAAALFSGVPPETIEDFVHTVRDRTAPRGRDGSSAILWREYAASRMRDQSEDERYAFTLRRVFDFAHGRHRERIRRTRHAPGPHVRCPVYVQMPLPLRPAPDDCVC